MYTHNLCVCMYYRDRHFSDTVTVTALVPWPSSRAVVWQPNSDSATHVMARWHGGCDNKPIPEAWTLKPDCQVTEIPCPDSTCHVLSRMRICTELFVQCFQVILTLLSQTLCPWDSSNKLPFKDSHISSLTGLDPLQPSNEKTIERNLLNLQEILDIESVSEQWMLVHHRSIFFRFLIYSF
jgi:hypothetical protein